MLIYVIFLFFPHVWSVNPAHSHFMSKVWSTQAPQGPPPVLKLDSPITSVWPDITAHLKFCEDQGFGEFSRCLPDEAKEGDEVCFNGLLWEASTSPSRSDPHDVILTTTRLWTKAVISDFSVCPFTIDEVEAGIPKGKIRYTVSNAASVAESFCDFWKEISAVLENSSEEVATVLLMFGEESLFLNDIDKFENFSECLDDSLKHNALGMEEEIQLVYFHPRFKFRDKDGQDHIIFNEQGEALGLASEMDRPIDFSRRSPYPTINILRAKQVNKVQNGVPVGQIFYNNVKNLENIGVDRLANMLEERDWSDLPVISSHARRRATKGQQQHDALDDMDKVADVVKYLKSSSSTPPNEEESWKTDSTRAVSPWVEYISSDGLPYFHNPTTGETTWEKPTTERSAPLSSGTQGEWQQHHTAEGVPYFFNPSTGQSVWEHPTST